MFSINSSMTKHINNEMNDLEENEARRRKKELMISDKNSLRNRQKRKKFKRKKNMNRTEGKKIKRNFWFC